MDHEMQRIMSEGTHVRDDQDDPINEGEFHLKPSQTQTEKIHHKGETESSPEFHAFSCGSQSPNSPLSQAQDDFKKLKCTALELESTESTLTTGCCNLDKHLNGGMPGFGLTELTGPSGTGKTQLALQLCLTVQLPIKSGGLDAGAVYINTERAFPSKRLAELTKHFQSKFHSQLPDDPMENIIVEHVADSESLTKCVTQRLPVLVKERKIGLVVLDSIAGIFRSEYDFKQQKERSKDLKLMGRTLHDLASRNKFVLIVINQVTASFSSSFEDIPSLGVLWRSIVTTRIQLHRKENKRCFHIPFSPHIPMRIIPYEICSEGVKFKEERDSN